MPSRKSRPRAPIQVPAGVVTARGTREDRAMADETFRWFAGVDWGSAKHQVCLLDRAGKVVGERAFAHGGAVLAALCDWLVSAAGLDFLPESGGMRSEYHAAARIVTASMLARASAG